MKVFLTGASSGIGEALARLYAGRGATLGLLARRGDLLAALGGRDLDLPSGGAESHGQTLAQLFRGAGAGTLVQYQRNQAGVLSGGHSKKVSGKR